MVMPLRRSDRRAAHHIHFEAARNRLLRVGALLAATLAAGTLGYHLVEGWSFLDSLYMTVITLATVGYGETHPLSHSGRVFTIVFIISAIGIMGYAISALATFVLEGELNRYLKGRQMDKRIAGLSDHIIVCGAGHTGYHIAAEFHKTGTPFVVIERSAENIEHLLELGDIHHIQGDATHDEMLTLAGIQRAHGLLTVLSEDKDNVFVVLSARALNPQLRIVARLIEDESAAKLRKAGADEVVSPNMIGGLRMASVMLRPTVVAFLDQMLRTETALRFEQHCIAASSTFAGKTLRHTDIGRRTGAHVVAIHTREGGYKFNPRGEQLLEAGDTLIVLGSREQIERIEGLASS